MQVVFDFISGTISFEEFVQAWNEDPGICDWLDNLLDLRNRDYSEIEDSVARIYTTTIHRHFSGSFKTFIYTINDGTINPEKFKDGSLFRGLYKRIAPSAIYDAVSAVVRVAYPGIPQTNRYDEMWKFYDAVLGESIGGFEVDDFINRIICQFPESMPKGKRKKEVKAAMKEGFHIGKRPVWAQEPEWPMGKNSPMRYLSRKTNGEQVLFTFEDVDTGEIRIVEQFY